MLIKILYFLTLIFIFNKISYTQTKSDLLEIREDSLVTIKLIEVTDSGKAYSEIKEPLNYINPFGPTLYFSFNIVSESTVNFFIYNEKGELYLTTTEQNLSKGKYRIYFKEIKNYQPGIYFYKIKTNDKTETKKFIIMK